MKTTTILAIAITASVPISAMADIVAQQYQDFQPFYNGHPDTDGTGTWRYMYSDNFNPADPGSTTGDLIGYIQNGWVGYWVDPPSDLYPDVQISPDGRVTMIGQEGPICPEQYCVMRWTSGVMGLVNVTGTWTHYHNVLNDGMDVAVFVDGVEKFWTIFSSGSVSFDFDIPISIGSTVDFVVGNNPPLTWSNDRAYIETTVTLLEEPPDIEVSPESWDFGDVGLGLSETKTFAISSAGGDDLVITDIQVSDPDFLITSAPPLPVSLSPGSSVEVEVKFEPSAYAGRLDFLEISSNDPDESLFAALLLGVGVNKTISGTIYFLDADGNPMERDDIPALFRILVFEANAAWFGSSILSGNYSFANTERSWYKEYSLTDKNIVAGTLYDIGVSASETRSDLKVLPYVAVWEDADLVVTLKNLQKSFGKPKGSEASKTEYTYFFNGFEPWQENAVIQAMYMWEDTGLVSFISSDPWNADITFEWASIGDDAGHCIGSGRKGTLPYTISFNSDFPIWTDDRSIGWDSEDQYYDSPSTHNTFPLTYIAVHEIGHALGLRINKGRKEEELPVMDSGDGQFTVMSYYGRVGWLGYSDVWSLQKLKKGK